MILLLIIPIGLNLLTKFCPGGGTGRRAGFKIQFLQGSAGSIPAPGTISFGLKSILTFLKLVGASR